MPITEAERWRARHRRRGERYRWLRAMPAGTEDIRSLTIADRDGRIYIEETVPEAARALVHSTVADVVDEEYGLFPTGSTQISVMPDESYLDRLDRIVLPDRQLPARPTIERGADVADVFIRTPVVSINEVRRGAAVYRDGTDYEATATGLEWLPIFRPADDAVYRYGHGATIVRGSGATDDVSAISGINAVYLVDGTAVTDYVENTHYSVTAGVLTWLGATKPVTGQSYVVAALFNLTRDPDAEDETDVPGGIPAVGDATVVRKPVGVGTMSYRRDIDWEVRDGGVHWFPAQPVEGEPYAVDYFYNPTYIFLRNSVQVPRPDRNGVLMPLRGLLVEKLPTEGD